MKKTFLILLFSLGYIMYLFAQPTNDAGLWTTFNVNKKLKRNFGVFLTEEYRLRENFSQTNLFYTDIGTEVRPLSFLKVSIAYRLIEKFINDKTFSYRHRLMLNISLKQKLGDATLSYRQRLQSEVRNIYSSAIGNIPEWYSRNKFELKYDINKPITPYIATEFRYQINNPRAVESNGLWHRNRYFVGLDYKRSDKHSFGLYYMLQREFNVSSPQNIYIIGLEYSISL